MRKLIWIGSSEKDFNKFPIEIKETALHALSKAQEGSRALGVKTFRGSGDASIVEIIDNDESGTYRTVYTVRFPKALFVLHAFQKKSKSGIKTPKQDIDLIERRLKTAEQIYKQNFKGL
jgi:phage-related protein